MSEIDLRARYKNSPEMFIDQPGDDKSNPPKESRVGELMLYIRNHPDIRKLKNVQPGLANTQEIKDRLKKIRRAMLKELAGVKENDLTEQEIEWASEVLALRIDHAYSVKELLDDLEVDACVRDFDRASYDVRRIRKGNETNEVLGGRYPSMVHPSAPSPAQYLRLEQDVAQTVPEVNLDDVGEESE